MRTLFEYNWQVRNEWFEWCKNVPLEELLKERVGGIGNILHTLLHIVDVEYSWIRVIEGKSDFELDFKDYQTVESVKVLSDQLHLEIKDFLQKWASEMDNEQLTLSWTKDIFTKGEILRHIIAHEIHHIGQLSIWAREIGLQPISANLIRRNLMKNNV